MKLRQLLALAAPLACLGASNTAVAQWTDGFESYAAGTPIEGQGGWESWTGAVNYPYNTVDGSMAFSGSRSLRVVGSGGACAFCSDTTYELPTPITTGSWSLTVWQYVPSSFSGQSYFLGLNDYAQPAGPYSWALQAHVESASARFTVDALGTGTNHAGPQPIGFDRWVPIEVELSPATRDIAVSYDGVLMRTAVYTGPSAFDAIDLFPGTDLTSAIHYDDFSLERRSTVGTRFCTAVPNSTGEFATITGVGSDVAANNNLTLEVNSLPQGSNGFFFTSQQRNIVASPGNSVGNICIASFAIGRYDGDILNSGSGGFVSLSLDLTMTPLQPGGPVAILPGDTWYWQYWYRDTSPGGAISNFSTALCVEFQ